MGNEQWPEREEPGHRPVGIVAKGDLDLLWMLIMFFGKQKLITIVMATQLYKFTKNQKIVCL